ncbi:hypothetical protein NQ318_003779 [Aromia moschata]|uniref:DUF5641 domain-containing protein n=1 Tax=Aromia moschata TaxID=1265417 RepID=A0AAV8YIU4_9CUCU|nr:hypothetical protein NQ318_003779 [Aromia moschata]
MQQKVFQSDVNCASQTTDDNLKTLETKWRFNKGQLVEGMLVLIKNDQSLPTNWQLGRIVELHSGLDRIARVASIRTQSGVIRRSFQMICPLPLDD